MRNACESDVLVDLSQCSSGCFCTLKRVPLPQGVRGCSGSALLALGTTGSGRAEAECALVRLARSRNSAEDHNHPPPFHLSPAPWAPSRAGSPSLPLDGVVGANLPMEEEAHGGPSARGGACPRPAARVLRVHATAARFLPHACVCAPPDPDTDTGYGIRNAAQTA